MRKIFFALFGIFGVLLATFIVFRMAGLIQYFVCPSRANEPNISAGAHLFATNMKQPALYDFICFAAINAEKTKGELLIYRLCAKGGDTVQIKDGVLTVNGIKTDKKIQLYGQFVLTRGDYAKLKTIDKEIYDNAINEPNDSFVYIFASDEFIRSNALAAVPLVYSRDYVDPLIEKQWGQNWNADQFGPVVVPTGSFFVLGDNRHNAIDSRYRGFIPLKDYRYVVVK